MRNILKLTLLRLIRLEIVAGNSWAHGVVEDALSARVAEVAVE